MPTSSNPIFLTYWEVNDVTGKGQRIATVASGNADSVRDHLTSLAVKPGARGRQVVVIAIDESHTPKGSGRMKAAPVRLNQTFVSGRAASDYLGYHGRGNPVAQALGDARRILVKEAVKKHGKNFTVAIRPEAIVDGITFQYEDDVRD